MHEQRVQAYLSLIQEILDCTSGEKPQILNRHLELLDEGFVQVCEFVTAQFQKAGRKILDFHSFSVIQGKHIKVGIS